MFRKLFLLILLLFSFNLIFSSENILLLNAYHTGYSWTDDLTEAIREKLESSENINLFVEYLDSKRFNDSSHFNLYKSYLLAKYQNISLKAIITSDNDALDFILNNRINKKWSLPVIFCGISNYHDYNVKNENLYGIIETDDWEPILNSIVDIHREDFENLYFIVENSPTGLIRKRSVESVFNKYKGKLKVNYIENYKYNSLIEQIKKISGKSVIYYPGVGIDYYNNPVNAEKCGISIIKNANVPVYTSYLSLIDTGAVGGYVGSAEVQGIETAKIALMIIRGIDANTIPRITIPQREFIFNYRIVKKFGIDLNRFPKNSVFLNKPKSIFSTYRIEAISMLILVIVLFGTTILLIFNMIKKVKAEKSIRDSEKKFMEISEMLPETVFEYDLEGKIIFINKFGRENFGYPREAFNGKLKIYDLIAINEHLYLKQNTHNLVNGEKPMNLVFKAVRKDGSTFPFEIHSTLILHNDQPIGVRGIGINVTRQKKFEKELIEAKKKAEESDKLKSSFLANMSHEIRTPLNSIVGFSYLMSERTLSEDEVKKMAGYIKNSSDHLLMLINDIIDISKIEAGQLDIIIKEFDISNVIKEICLYLEREKERTEKEHINTVVKNQIGYERFIIRSDALRLKQILLNLAGNALKFTEEGSIEIGCKNKNSEIIFYVRDTGIGISEDFKEKVFQRFTKLSSFSNKIYPGFGLGLAISRQLTELLKGKLWCESNKDKGTTFFLSVPVNPAS